MLYVIVLWRKYTKLYLFENEKHEKLKFIGHFFLHLHDKIYNLQVRKSKNHCRMAFRIRNRSLVFPNKYPTVHRKLATVTSESRTVVDGFVLRHKTDYIPQVGLQENVCASDCNLVFMCGQGTAGKTFSMYLKALQGIDKKDFKARLISVRALDSKKGSSMYADGVKVCGDFAGCQSSSSDIPTFYWEKTNKSPFKRI